MNSNITMLLVALVCHIQSNAQAVRDSGNKANDPKPYNEVIKPGVVTSKGLFTVHQSGNRYFFEIGDSLLDKEMLLVTRIASAPAGARSNIKINMKNYAGDIVNTRMFSFSRIQKDKILLTTKFETPRETSVDTSENGMARAIRNNDMASIVMAFDVKAYSPDSSGSVIDVTDYLNSENDLFFISKDAKPGMSITAYHPDKSFIKSIRPLGESINIRVLKTYSWGTINLSTYELSTSLVLLPREPMQPRYYDPRVGYFPAFFFPMNFDINPQGVDRSLWISRWRIEPKAADKEEYNNGILVEPQKPIVFYIDPATPKKWVPYLMQGVNDWQKAFEKAGFKNAVYAREIMSATEAELILNNPIYNVISYKPSDAMNASGPNIHDPRTGEILSADVNWYHNVMQLVKDWYFLQLGVVDPRARQLQIADSLMGRFIRYVCSHEIGHTLGLMHNFGASSTVPSDSLRNKKWVEENGFCPSIMDYARFNYAAQPEDNIGEDGLFPRIGAYDEWAIEYGYRYFSPFKNFQQQKSFLENWVTQKLNDNAYLWYGGEFSNIDPRTQAEDLGDDLVKTNTYGLKNLKIITRNLVAWTVNAGGDYEMLTNRYDNILDRFSEYLRHVTTIIAGVQTTPKTIHDKGPYLEYTSKAKQKAALSFLNNEVFITPEWLINKEIYSLTGVGGVYRIGHFQKTVIEKILSPSTLGNLLWAYTYQPQTAYSPEEFLKDLQQYILKELNTPGEIDLYRRNLQKVYVDRLIALLSPPKNAGGPNVTAFYNAGLITDISTLVRQNILELSSTLQKKIPLYKNGITKAHLGDLQNRLKEALEPTK